MNIIETLPIKFYQFQCPDSILDNTYIEIQKIKYVINNGDNCYISENHFYDKELFVWFQECIDKVSKIYYNPSLKLGITGCWVNKTGKYSHTLLHDHPNSILGGILYFSDETSSETNFCIPDPWLFVQANRTLIVGKSESTSLISNGIKSKIKPEKGKLILYPSSIKHWVTAYTGSNIRYTLAFNTFFTGILTADNYSTRLPLQSNFLDNSENS